MLAGRAGQKRGFSSLKLLDGDLVMFLLRYRGAEVVYEEKGTHEVRCGGLRASFYSSSSLQGFQRGMRTSCSPESSGTPAIGSRADAVAARSETCPVGSPAGRNWSIV